MSEVISNSIFTHICKLMQRSNFHFFSEISNLSTTWYITSSRPIDKFEKLVFLTGKSPVHHPSSQITTHQNCSGRYRNLEWEIPNAERSAENALSAEPEQGWRISVGPSDVSITECLSLSKHQLPCPSLIMTNTFQNALLFLYKGNMLSERCAFHNCHGNNTEVTIIMR